MTVTPTHRPATLPAQVPLFSSLLDDHCAALAAEPEPNLVLLRSAIATGLRVGRIAAIATSLVRLRDELDQDLEDLRTEAEIFDADLAAYMWAHLTLGLTETDVLTRCTGIFHACTGIADYLGPRDVATIRTRLEGLALATLQGWSHRLARTAATR